MPIVDVEIILSANETLRDTLAQELADGLGKAFNTPAGTTWVKVKWLAGKQYAESGGTSEGIRPVFVTILKASLPEAEEMKAEAEKTAMTVAYICDRPVENVHIIYPPEGRGRVAFGGRLE